MIAGRPVRALLLALALLHVPGASASAQVVAAVERKLLPLRFGALDAVPATFWDGLTFLREEEDRQRSLKADISFGLTGDEAGDESLFRLNTGIGLSRGIFPSEVSVVSRLFLQLRNGQLQEDLTSLQITYDYHASHHVEYFAFAERFSNSFLSIQQRYEVGFGARVGLQIGRTKDWAATAARFDAVERSLAGVETALAQSRGGPGAVAAAITPPEWARFHSALHDLAHALEYRQTRIFLAAAASLFSEIESASLNVGTFPVGGDPSDLSPRSRVTIPTQQRYRLSLRPSFRLRPSADVVITVLPYFKLPIDGPRRVVLPDGRRQLDYRRDILSEMSWTVRREQTGLENVALVLTFNHFYDPVPPALPASLVSDALASGRQFEQTSAATTHKVTALSLRLTW
jgi:hypothetical protein